MRTSDDFTYQEYKEDVSERMRMVGEPDWKTNNVTNWIIEEYGYVEGAFEGTDMALLSIALGTYEIEHNTLENRVLNWLSYYVPKLERGEFDENLTEEEKEIVLSDCEYVRDHMPMLPEKSAIVVVQPEKS